MTVMTTFLYLFSIGAALSLPRLCAFTPPQLATTAAPTALTPAATTAATAATLTPSPLAPLTIWGQAITDIRALQRENSRLLLPEFAPELSAIKDCGLEAGDVPGQLLYVRNHATELLQRMQTHGAIVFRDFDLMKTSEGFQEFYKAVGLKVCLDPLHSVSARPTVNGNKNSPVYEAVNKESRKNFFIGMYPRDCTLSLCLSLSLPLYIHLHLANPNTHTRFAIFVSTTLTPLLLPNLCTRHNKTQACTMNLSAPALRALPPLCVSNQPKREENFSWPMAGASLETLTQTYWKNSTNAKYDIQSWNFHSSGGSINYRRFCNNHVWRS
jgi:hypothetical protein